MDKSLSFGKVKSKVQSPKSKAPNPREEVNFSVQIGKLRMQNPVTAASGTFGYGVEYSRLVDLSQLGAVTVKGIRLNPVRGNPTPRTAEVASGMLNAIGLQGPGVDGFIKKMAVPQGS